MSCDASWGWADARDGGDTGLGVTRDRVRSVDGGDG